MKRVAFLFPGQGSQSVGMGKDFYENFQTAKEMFEEASDRIKVDMKKLLFEENDKLERTEFTQPAILLVSSVAHKIFENEMSIRSVFALGHSLGEFSALVSVGALNFADAIELVHKRGFLMQKACEGQDAGMMVLIGLADEIVEEICSDLRNEGYKVWPANYNSDGQIVVAGIKEDLKKAEPLFKERGAKRALLLNMSVASHCPLLESAAKGLEPYLQEFLKDEFLSDVISNVTAKSYNTKEEALKLLTEQLVKPVKYKHSIKNYENDTDIFIEFGGSVLRGINRKITKKPTLSVTDSASMQSVFENIK
ncbi:MAG: ACP S-malonyltransferase [Epsilonproteobacteria bacterium]|nr:ACP S-malonyltransferase [Campylobacterota bacterium]